MGGSTALDLLTALAVAGVLWCSPIVVLAVVLGSVLVVPDQLVVPHMFTPNLTVGHVVILAAGVRLLAMLRHGELSRPSVRATPVHLALGFLAVTWAATGVLFSADTADATYQVIRMVNLGCAGLTFVVVLALLRSIDRPWLVVNMLCVALGIVGGIAVVEHATGGSFDYQVFHAVGAGPTTLSANPLEARAGHLRVRSTAEFSLGFAWIAVMLSPLPLALLVRRRQPRLQAAAAGLIVLTALAVFWTYTRSALVGVPAAVIVMAGLARRRWPLRIAGVVSLASAIAVAAEPALRHHLSLTADSGSVAIRFQRLPLILRAVSLHPFRGLGFGGVEGINVPTTDNFYVLTYASTGVIGATALVVLLITVLGTMGRALLVADPGRGLVIAAAATGLVGFAASGLFDDALFLNQQSQLAFILLALLMATAEPITGPAAMPRFSLPRPALFAALGALAGWCVWLAAPAHVVQQRTFGTVSGLRLADPTDPVYTGNWLIGSVCQVAHDTVAARPQLSESCLDDYTAAGQGTLRIQGPSASAVTAAFDAISSSAAKVTYLSAYRTDTQGGPHRTQASGWRTAPAAGTVAGLAAGIIAPLPIRRRRRETGEPRATAGE